MTHQTMTTWKHLEPKPGSAYRQLFVKGTRIMARLLYGMHVNAEEPMSIEDLAEAYGLNKEAVAEAIAYCETDPPEIRVDWEMEEASIQDRLQREPGLIHPAMTHPPQVAS